MTKITCKSDTKISADNSATPPPTDRVPLSAQKKRLPTDSRLCDIVPDYRTKEGARTAAEAESRAKGGCCNRRLSGLMSDVTKIYFQAQSLGKHEDLRSKQQPTQDNSAEAPPTDRVPLSNENRAEKSARLKCG